MKTIYKSALICGVLALASCSSEELVNPEAKTGRASLTGIEVNNAENVINSRAVTDVSAYIVDFVRKGESAPAATYIYADMPGTVELPEGVYSVHVRSHDVKKAEWERPLFAGQSREFSITAGKLTEVDPVRCVFSSLKVTIVFGPKLRAAMSDDVKVIVAANDEGSLTYLPSEDKAGYFEAISGSTTLVATFQGTVNGNYENFFRSYTDVAAGQHRIITYEVGSNLPRPDDPSGTISTSGLKIDVTYVDVNLSGTVDPGKEDTLPDEDEPGQLPSIGGGDEPKPEEPITFSGTLHDGRTYTSTELSDYSVSIHTEKGCKDMTVNIDSTSLTPDELENVGLASHFSLVNDSQFFEGLDGLGLPCGDRVKNRTDIDFSITGFMDLLAILGPSRSVFTLDVTDNDGNNKKISFTIVVE